MNSSGSKLRIHKESFLIFILMQERHKNRRQYFIEQSITTRDYVIPYIQNVKKVDAHSKILEIGCGEGGNLVPFIEMGCKTVGVDISQGKINLALEFLSEFKSKNKPVLMTSDVYDLNPDQTGLFDVIFLRDVIEHIPDQQRFLHFIKNFLKPDGVIFFGFPPWQMPFGGHQQTCNSKVLSKLPYFHLLPSSLYKGVLKLFGERDEKVKGLLEIKDTGLSIERFILMVKAQEFTFLKMTYFLINPNYRIKYGLQPKVLPGLFRSIPYLNNFITTCIYAVIQKDNSVEIQKE